MTGQLASELAALIGRQAILETGQERLRVAVIVREAKTSYGRPRVLVAPVAGDSTYGVWIDAERLLEMPPHLVPKPPPDPKEVTHDPTPAAPRPRPARPGQRGPR